MNGAIELERWIASAEGAIRPADVILVVPPYALPDKPSLALHLLQACSKPLGFTVSIFYANFSWASLIGVRLHEELCLHDPEALLAERTFAVAAFGTAVPTHFRQKNSLCNPRNAQIESAFPLDQYDRICDLAEVWTARIAELLAKCKPRIIGCSTMFQQTCASTALLRQVKQFFPGTITILGGANCEGEMAEGMASIALGIDHIFAGESERSFTEFLNACLNHGPVPDRIIQGSACENLDELPLPDYSDFVNQRRLYSPLAIKHAWITYETSRGCWWGAKRQCTFCGLNGLGISFRAKSAEKVLADLRQVKESTKIANICMVDNIMPHQYFRTLLPALIDAGLDLHVFYEQKANLTLSNVSLLKEAGVDLIQPGIEALSDHLLRLMRKGVTTAQNINLLRWARSVGISLNWNLLYGFPGDKREWYEDTIQLIPSLIHLPPPTGVFRLSLERFSPYLEAPADFGIGNVRSHPSYKETYPSRACHEKLAYHFQGEYESESLADPDLVAELKENVDRWRAAWEDNHDRPVLTIIEDSANRYILIDTRFGRRNSRTIDTREASFLITGKAHHESSAALYEWARKEQLVAFQSDGTFFPIAFAEQRLMHSLAAIATNPQVHLPEKLYGT